MDIGLAIRILDPETSAEALAEIEYYGGFRGRTKAANALYDACILAVAALKEQERMEQAEESGKPERHGRWIDRIDTDTPMHECSVCGARVVKGLYEYENPNLYCYRCGARMDLGEEGGTNETDM